MYLALKVFYGTRPYWRTEVEAVQRRLDSIEKTRGIRLSVPPWECGEANTYSDEADAIISAVPDSYSRLGKPLAQVNNSFCPHNPQPIWAAKRWKDCQNHFLWAGTGSLVRKGLNMVLEAFTAMPEKHLWICAPFHWQDHRNFLQLFREELFYQPNIHPVGFVKIASREWRMLTNHCGFFIFPSCAEIMCGGVLNAMARGLVPLVSAESTVDVGAAGLVLSSISVEAVYTAMAWADNLSPGDLEERAREAYNIAISKHETGLCVAKLRTLLADMLDPRSGSLTGDQLG